MKASARTKRIIKLLVACCVVASFALFNHNDSKAVSQKEYVDGEVIVQVKELLPDALDNFGITGVEQICRDKNGQSKIYVLHFDETEDVPLKAEQLMKSGYFSWAEPNGFVRACTVPNDSMFFRQYGLQNLGNFNLTFSTADSDADLPEAWNIEQGDSNVVVAVLDGGVAFGHPELAGRFWQNYADPVNGFDDDGNGYPDDYRGWNFAYNTNDPADDLGHGTSVAGIIGANGNNSVGLAGVDWNCKLMICKVLDSTNYGSYAAIADAIYYATDNGADIINMSFGGGSSSVISNAVQYAWNNNVVMCAASGNGNTSVPLYPAADSLVLAVGGSNAWDVRYQFSNYGPHLDVVAAGDYIYILDYANFSNYSDYSSGTSLASPFVAGVAALLKAQDSTRTNQEIYNIIRATAEDTVDEYNGEDTPGWDQYFGYGRVNAFNALMYDSLLSSTFDYAQSDNSNHMSIYPNPMTDHATITFDQPVENAILEIYDARGRLVIIQAHVCGLTIPLMSGDLVPGTYLVAVKKNERIVGRDFVVVTSIK